MFGEEPFPGWSVKERLGKGGFGNVYRAEKDGYNSALKQIIVPNDNEYNKILAKFHGNRYEILNYYRPEVERMKKEIELMRNLSGVRGIVIYHDHIIREYETRAGWEILIRMEYLQTFDGYINKNGITTRQILKLGIELCNALEVCCKEKIWHRDIKENNILVDNRDSFKLCDFGVSKKIDGTHVSTRVGTLGYMAPEIARGEKYDYRADMYSLGIVIYKMFNERRIPFTPRKGTIADDEKSRHLMLKGISMPCPKHCNEEIASVIFKACEYNKENRYTSFREMGDALENLLGNLSNELLNMRLINPVEMNGAYNLDELNGVKTFKEAGHNLEADGTEYANIVHDKGYVVNETAWNLEIDGAEHSNATYDKGHIEVNNDYDLDRVNSIKVVKEVGLNSDTNGTEYANSLNDKGYVVNETVWNLESAGIEYAGTTTNHNKENEEEKFAGQAINSKQENLTKKNESQWEKNESQWDISISEPKYDSMFTQNSFKTHENAGQQKNLEPHKNKFRRLRPIFICTIVLGVLIFGGYYLNGFLKGKTYKLTNNIKSSLPADNKNVLSNVSLESTRDYAGHSKPVTSAMYNIKGNKIVSASYDNTIKEWDTETGKCIWTYEGHLDKVNTVVYSKDDSKILSASDDKTIKEWDVKTRKCITTHKNNGNIYGAIYNDNGKKILFSSDEIIKELDTKTGKLHTYKGYTAEGSAVYNKDGSRILFINSADKKKLTEVNAVTGAVLNTYSGHKSEIKSFMYIKNYDKILTSSTDGTVKEWDAKTKECVNSYETGDGNYLDAAFYNKNEDTIWSISANLTVKRLDLKTKKVADTYENTFSHNIEFNNDGKRILTTANDIIKEYKFKK